MLTGMTPDAGSQVAANAQTVNQRVFIVRSTSWATTGSVPDAERASLPTKGMGKVRFNLLLFPSYSTGVATFLARNYIAWRIVGSIGPDQPPTYTGITPASRPLTPITTPQLLPVGQPISITLDVSAFQALYLEFDTSSGTPAVNQGRDQVLVTMMASA